MWFDESGFKRNGPTPYNQRKLAELRVSMTIEEKYLGIIMTLNEYQQKVMSGA